MSDARGPYLVQVNSIYALEDGATVVTKAWLNIYYITSVCDARTTERLYNSGARWCVMLTNGSSVLVDDDSCEKIIAKINGSY